MTNSVGGISLPGSSQVSIYGSPPLYSNYFVLNHRGYIFAQQSGTYTFSVGGVDDAVYIWIGPLAYTGWTKQNANVFLTYPRSGNFQINLVKGNYYPLRIAFAQAQGAASF